MNVVSEKDKEFFKENGYVVIRDVVPQEPLEKLRLDILSEFDRTKKQGHLFIAGGSITGHLNCFPGVGARAVYDVLIERGIVDLVKELCPQPVPYLNVGCNFNLPGSVTQHYHIDGVYTHEFIECNVAAVDTDLINGAIEVAPGTQKKFYKYWEFVLGRPERRRLELKQGDILIRSSNLWHRGMPNKSRTARPMLAFVWTEEKDKKDDPFAENNGAIKFKKNWYRTDFLGQIREQAYVAAPFTYSTYRFIRSLFGNRGYDSY